MNKFGDLLSHPKDTQYRRDPLFIQIGFDFGTAYSKCICRDIITDKSWVHIPSEIDNDELPFLIRGLLHIEDGKLRKIKKNSSSEVENVLYNLKQALEKIALQDWGDPILDTYSTAIGTKEPKKLSSFIEACSVYFLAGALGDVRTKVRQRLNAIEPHPSDYMAVNLAVPVADAERPKINQTYHRVLCMAWKLADTFAGHPPIALNELERLLCHYDSSVQEACYIYPEVSANVQGFVRSRASSPGIYLFSDTGAGTVDQGIFIFFRDKEKKDCLTYLHGSVLPLGSSYIERFAAEISKNMSFRQLEHWRDEKERGGSSQELNKARKRISEPLSAGTTKTIESSKKKLFVKDQIHRIRIIFGGGGHCIDPYQSAVLLPFSGNVFEKPFTPDIVGLPRPHDLDIGSINERWLRRLSVAYGLSFLKNELTRFIYPVNVSNPKAEEIWLPKANSPKIISVKKSCSCGGRNQDCYLCGGRGIIQDKVEKRIVHSEAYELAKLLQSPKPRTKQSTNDSISSAQNMRPSGVVAESKSNKLINCQYCNMTIEISSMKKHVFALHNKKYSEYLQRNSAVDSLKTTSNNPNASKNTIIGVSLKSATDKPIISLNLVTCEICNCKVKANRLQKHIDKAHNCMNDVLVECEICKKQIKSKTLKNHIKLFHGNMSKKYQLVTNG